jgi:hypothetical protein
MMCPQSCLNVSLSIQPIVFFRHVPSDKNIIEIKSSITALREWAAPLDVTKTLQKSSKDISARVTGMEGITRGRQLDNFNEKMAVYYSQKLKN